jgi:hypothetical protein
MAAPTGNFILNIVELQNVVTSASGVSPVTYLSNQVTNIQQMVNYDLKQINVNAISNFDTTPIQVYSPINMCNVALTSNGNIIGGTTSQNTTLGAGSAGTLYVGTSTTSLLLTQGAVSSFYIGTDCNATFYGTVTANQFITSSDLNRKRDIRPITSYETILSSINGVHFKWKEGASDDVGVIAQEVLPVLPEAVYLTDEGYRVAYMKLIPVLIEAVKSLQGRVTELERQIQTVPGKTPA